VYCVLGELDSARRDTRTWSLRRSGGALTEFVIDQGIHSRKTRASETNSCLGSTTHFFNRIPYGIGEDRHQRTRYTRDE